MKRSQQTPGNPPRERLCIQTHDRSALWMRDRDQTDVATVEGGWLLRFRHDGGAASAMSTQAMTFVPDPTHHLVASHGQATLGVTRRLRQCRL